MRKVILKISVAIYAIFAFFFLFTGFVFAHGEGASLEKEVDGKIVDVGYSPEEARVDIPVRFDFSLTDAVSGEDAPFTDIWVQVHQERKTFFAGGVHKPSIGAATMLYQFPASGDYTLTVRFQNDLESVAEASFPFPVSESEATEDADSDDTMDFILPGILGLVGGILLSLIIRKF